MGDGDRVPPATLQRLSLYHAYLEERLRRGGLAGITSREISGDLSLKEETVRRDLSYLGDLSRPGIGYDAKKLREKAAEVLGIDEEYPLVKIGTASVLRAHEIVFPEDGQGVRTVAVFSELPSDAGESVDGVPVKHLADLRGSVDVAGAVTALVACSPGWVQVAIDRLAIAQVDSIMLLTPVVRFNRPRGVHVTHLRVPCDIKTMACRYSHRSGAEESARGAHELLDARADLGRVI